MRVYLILGMLDSGNDARGCDTINSDSQLLVASTEAVGDVGGILIVNQDQKSSPHLTGSPAEVFSHGMLVFLSDK